jgi:hypothetical protein
MRLRGYQRWRTGRLVFAGFDISQHPPSIHPLKTRMQVVFPEEIIFPGRKQIAQFYQHLMVWHSGHHLSPNDVKRMAQIAFHGCSILLTSAGVRGRRKTG